MSYEYRTQAYVGTIPPDALKPPDGFRLREMQFVNAGSSETMTTGFHSGPDGSVVPYTQSLHRSTFGSWVVIWERYVPDKEEE
jgi:hypothetical protein